MTPFALNSHPIETNFSNYKLWNSDVWKRKRKTASQEKSVPNDTGPKSSTLLHAAPRTRFFRFSFFWFSYRFEIKLALENYYTNKSHTEQLRVLILQFGRDDLTHSSKWNRAHRTCRSVTNIKRRQRVHNKNTQPRAITKTKKKSKPSNKNKGIEKINMNPRNRPNFFLFFNALFKWLSFLIIYVLVLGSLFPFSMPSNAVVEFCYQCDLNSKISELFASKPTAIYAIL